METFLDRLRFLVNEKSDGKHTVFAKKAGIPIGTFQNYMKGKLPNPAHLLRILETFSVSIDWLLAGKGSPYLESYEIAGCDETGNIVDFKHVEVIKGFKNKPMARDANTDLRDIEAINDSRFVATCSYIKGVADTLRSQCSAKDEDERQSTKG